MKEKLEQILNCGKKFIATGLTLTLIGLTTPYCGSGGGGGGNNPNPTTYQCNNHKDDDGDTKIDMADPGCSSPSDNSEYNSAANAPPVINSKSVQYAYPETGNNFNYTANVTDPDNNLNSVNLEVSTDGTNYASYPMISTGSNDYGKTVVFDDGVVVRSRIRARDSQSLDTVSTFSDVPVYLSEADGQDAILSGIPDFKTDPSSTLIDEPQTFVRYHNNIDVLLKFSSLNGILYNNDLRPEWNGCNNARVPFEYISLGNEMNSTEMDDLEADVSTFPYCGVIWNGTPYAFFNFNNLEVPTKKAEISDTVNDILINEDLKINYKPVADAGINQNMPSESCVTLPFPPAIPGSDLDGAISSYEWDTNGDGTYDWSSTTSGSVNVCNPDGNYTLKIKVTDDEGATATDTTNVCIGPGC